MHTATASCPTTFGAGSDSQTGESAMQPPKQMFKLESLSKGVYIHCARSSKFFVSVHGS